TPLAGVTIAGNLVFGTAFSGGSGANGTVFNIAADGSGFQTMHAFTAFSSLLNTNDDGAAPFGDVVLSSNMLYGTAARGGAARGGTVFSMNIDGSRFALVYSFTNPAEGGGPEGALAMSSNTLYGTTVGGGAFNNGTVFKVNTDGTDFTTL